MGHIFRSQWSEMAAHSHVLNCHAESLKFLLDLKVLTSPYQRSLKVFDVILAIELKYVNYYFVDFVLKPNCIIIGECVLKVLLKVL